MHTHRPAFEQWLRIGVEGDKLKQGAAQPRKLDEQHAATLNKVTGYVEEQLITGDIDWKGKCSGHVSYLVAAHHVV